MVENSNGLKYSWERPQFVAHIRSHDFPLSLSRVCFLLLSFRISNKRIVSTLVFYEFLENAST